MTDDFHLPFVLKISKYVHNLISVTVSWRLREIDEAWSTQHNQHYSALPLLPLNHLHRLFPLFSVLGVGGAQAGGVFDRDQREIFETRRLELVALGKVRVLHVQYVLSVIHAHYVIHVQYAQCTVLHICVQYAVLSFVQCSMVGRISCYFTISSLTSTLIPSMRITPSHLFHPPTILVITFYAFL